MIIYRDKKDKVANNSHKKRVCIDSTLVVVIFIYN